MDLDHDTRCLVARQLEPHDKLALRAVSVEWRDAADEGMCHKDAVDELRRMLESTLVDVRRVGAHSRRTNTTSHPPARERPLMLWRCRTRTTTRRYYPI